MEEDFNTIKPVIRSILLSLGRTATEKVFRSEYYNVEGISINVLLNKFNCSFIDFLKRMPDVCRVWRYGDETMIERVSSIETCHMDNLTIDRRKKKKRNYPIKFLNFPSTRYNQQMSYNKPSSIASFYQNLSKPTLPRFNNASSPQMPCRPPIQYKAPTTQYMPAHQPPRHNAPVNLSSFRRDVPTIVYKASDGLEQDKVVEKNSLNQALHEQLLYDIKMIEQQISSKPVALVEKTNKPLVVNHNTSKESKVKKLEDKVTPLVQRLRNVETVIYKHSNDDESEAELAIVKQQISTNNNIANKENTLPSVPLNDAVPQTKGCIIDHRDLKGWSDDEDDLPNKLKSFVNLNGWQPMNFKSTNPFFFAQADYAIKNIKSVLVSKTSAVSQKPKSLTVAPKLARDTISSSVPSQLVQQVQSPKIVNHVKPPKEVQTQAKKTRLEPKVDLLDITVDLSDYITRPSRIPFAQMIKLGFKSLPVEIVKATSPSQFIFKFNPSELEAMMVELQFHYNYYKGCPELRVKKIVPNMSVVAFVDNTWYRAEILCITLAGIFINLVDYGNMMYAKADQLLYLEKTFSTTSRKACRGKLFGIRPSNGTILWSSQAISKFKKKVEGVNMLAYVRALKDGVFSISLIDNLTNRNQVSKYLIAEGVADDKNIEPEFSAILV